MYNEYNERPMSYPKIILSLVNRDPKRFISHDLFTRLRVHSTHEPPRSKPLFIMSKSKKETGCDIVRKDEIKLKIEFSSV